MHGQARPARSAARAVRRRRPAMRILVLVTTRQKAISAEALAIKTPESVKRSAEIELFAAIHPQGSGANQKVGFRYALEKGFDAVAVFPDEALAALEKLPAMAGQLSEHDADLVLGAARTGPITAF